MTTMSADCKIEVSYPVNGTLLIHFIGSWKITGGQPSIDVVTTRLDSDSSIRHIAFDAERLEAWDTTLLTFLTMLLTYCENRQIDMDQTGLPAGVRRLVTLALAVPEKREERSKTAPENLFTKAGTKAISFIKDSSEVLAFAGETFVAFAKLLGGKARFRRIDLVLFVQECGADALPIVTLISVLVGLILAFVGAVQLRMFGAEIYVADIVGIGMVREMGAMMAAIIMAGRTGAAFAAQLGTMQVNEEIDALTTLGISPIEFLVLPRILALVLMMPLLCLYADFMGILGGVFVGVTMLDLPLVQYMHQTQAALNLPSFAFGLVKSIMFGILVALSGCLRGMQCGRSASAVGLAATSAVVSAIVAIVVADGLFAVLSDVLGI